MLGWLIGLVEDPAAVEARVLRELVREAPELPDWSAEVQLVLARLLARSAIRTPMVSRVLCMPVLNALALPHQTMVLAQPLVEFCRGERDQIAFVVAHEAAHIHLGHAGSRARANALVTVLRTANPLVGMGLRMLFDRAYSREQEFEADRVAVALCFRAGYAPEAAVAFLARLGLLSRSPGTAASALQLLSTHPPLPERIAELQSLVTSIRLR